MSHPLIEEFCRVHGLSSLQPHFFNRCQREFREQVQPMLDERERLLVENADLKLQIEALTKRQEQAKKKTTTEAA